MKSKTPLRKLPKSTSNLAWPAEAAMATGAEVAIGQSVLLPSSSAGCKIASEATYRLPTAALAEPAPPPLPYLAEYGSAGA